MYVHVLWNAFSVSEKPNPVLQSSDSYSEISFANKIENKVNVLILIKKTSTLDHDVKAVSFSRTKTKIVHYSRVGLCRNFNIWDRDVTIEIPLKYAS